MCLTYKNYTPIDNGFIEFNTILILDNNSISEITKQIFQQIFMIKIKCDFISENTFYFDPISSTTTLDKIDYPVTAVQENLKMHL